MATTREVLREDACKELGLAFIDVPCGATDADTLTSAGVRDLIGATDNRILEGAFVMLRNNVSTAYSTAAQLSGDITAAATTITHNGSVSLEAESVGDVITIESEDMLITDFDNASNQITVVRGYNNTTAAAHLDTTAITSQLNGRWRSIASHSFGTDAIELTRAIWQGIASPAANVKKCDIYFILTPVEMNDCIDVALSKLWFRDRASITLNTTDNRYSLSTLTWLTSGAQLMELKYRITDSANSNKDVRERPVVNRLIEVDADVLAITLYDLPSSTDDYTLEVVGRHYYEALATDASTTTCPLPLARAAIKYELLKKIFNKLGQAAKQNFGMEIVLAEQELERVRARYRQAIVPVELTVEEPYDGPEVPVRDSEYDWI